MKPAKQGNRARKAGQIAGLRRRAAARFAVRGTSREFVFSTAKPGRVPHRPHVYHIEPLYKMSFKEWVKRLQATLHAAVARGMN